MNMFKIIALFFFLVTGIFLGQPAFAANGQNPAFLALTGTEAENFQLTFDMRLVKTMALANNEVYGRYQQFFGDVEVLGGQVTVIKDSNGINKQIIGSYYSEIRPANFRNLTANDAATKVSADIGSGGKRKIDAMIDPETGNYFYRIETRRANNRWFHWIKADDGQIINSYDGLTHGSGYGVLNDDKDLAGLTTLTDSQYQMVSGDGRQKTYDARNRNGLPGNVATDDNDVWNTLGRTSPGQPAIVDAQFYAKVTDDYYLETHVFDWIDHYNQGMVSSAHLKRNYNNAFWNGEQMAYGDGDGSTFIEFSGDLDVVGHELTHGVTEATSNLIYQNESGALNEAFSDIMGTAIEWYKGSSNWTIGEDVTLSDFSSDNSKGIRSLSDPTVFGDPSHYADRYTGTSDNGGVHTNSGIANHWFYLLVNGGQNAKPSRASGTDVAGIGLPSAEQIAFKGFTALQSNADFCAARASTIAFAASNAATNVADAWDEVGVDQTLCEGGGGGGGGGTGPVISNLDVQLQKGPKFTIGWTTDKPSNSVVTFSCCGTYTNASLVTSHSMPFTGSNGTNYTGYVQSTDADGNTSAQANFSFTNN